MPYFLHRLKLRYSLVTNGLFVLFLLVMSPQSDAGVVKNLYSVEIPIIDQKARTRIRAFNQGLKEVIIRVTGDSHIFSMIKLPRSSAYVKQFQYHELAKTNKPSVTQHTDDQVNRKHTEPTQLLWVQFNETKVNDFIRHSALPLWGKRRNETVMWLAVNDGVNRYILKNADESLLKTVTDDALKRRAIPIIWPDVKRSEQAIRFADVWAGFERPIINLSSEYSNGPVIVGRLQWKAERWSSQWSLILDGNKTDWVIDNANYSKLLVKAVDIAADAMGQQYALFDTGDVKSFHSLAIQINNINSIEALNKVKKYLLTVPMMQQIVLQRIENNRVFFDVDLRTNTDDFLNVLQEDLKLVPVSDENITNNDLVSAGSVQSTKDTADYQFQFQP